MRQLFVVPKLDGPVTGGTLYNRGLLAALGQPERYRHCTLQELPGMRRAFRPERLWVDSLYLEHVPLLAAKLEVGVLLHYLPSLLRLPRPPRRARELEPREQHAFECAARVLVPSSSMARLVHRLYPRLRVDCVAPGVDTIAPPAPARELRRAVMLCNVVENKGVLEFIGALAEHARAGDRFALAIIGSLSVQPSYARACRRLVERSPRLRGQVEFLGALPQARAFAQLAAAGLCISASRMESFGMALAEARAHGTPLLARRGGHVARQVSAAHGGELVADEQELAAAWLRLLHAPKRLRRRIALAERRPWRRSWTRAAREFERKCG
jgi:glycosyltransferase involved in cell wall biosynthesis